jgi:hypothetical protein
MNNAEVYSFPRVIIHQMSGTEAGCQPAISIVIPVCNGTGTLRACLESAYRSTFSDFEVVLVDDGSVDGSAAVAGSFPCTLLQLAKNLGAATASIAEAIGSCSTRNFR